MTLLGCQELSDIINECIKPSFYSQYILLIFKDKNFVLTFLFSLKDFLIFNPGSFHPLFQV